jgi:hypothetical protein
LDLDETLTVNYIKDNIMNLMSEIKPNVPKSGTIDAKNWLNENMPGENFCNVCYLELEDIKDFQHFGCGHMFCHECMKDYLTHEIDQGASCLNMKCAYFGCDQRLDKDLIFELCEVK